LTSTITEEKLNKQIHRPRLAGHPLLPLRVRSWVPGREMPAQRLGMSTFTDLPSART
jgi:hypothetical protein